MALRKILLSKAEKNALPQRLKGTKENAMHFFKPWRSGDTCRQHDKNRRMKFVLKYFPD